MSLIMNNTVQVTVQIAKNLLKSSSLMYKYLNVMQALAAFLPFSVRLHPQSGWSQEAPSKGALDWAACEDFNKTSSPFKGEAGWGWKKGS
jgi:hypothetical protein